VLHGITVLCYGVSIYNVQFYRWRAVRRGLSLVLLLRTRHKSALVTIADAVITGYFLQERRTYEAARADYILAMADYECMHNLEITT
jgi:hypothetical protein